MSFVKRSLTNLPLDELIGAPLTACAKAQQLLAQTTVDFIRDVGLKENDSGNAELKMVSFTYSTNETDSNGDIQTANVTISVPLLTIVNVPSLSIQTCDINFEMNVSQTRTTNASASVAADYNAWYSPVSVSFKGSVSSSSTKSASAKYIVNVHAADNGPADGLTKVLGMLDSAITQTQA